MYDQQLVERLEWLENKIDEMMTVIDNDGAFMFATEEDVDDFYQRLGEYEIERDELREYFSNGKGTF